MFLGIINLMNIVFFISNQQFFVDSFDLKCRPLHYRNAQVTINDANNLATIKCNENYFLEGNEDLICVNRKWQRTVQDKCVHKECLNSTKHIKIENGKFKFIYSLSDHERVIEYQCNDNYKMIGNVISTCTDGKWSNPSPVCKFRNNYTTEIDPNCLNNSLYYTLENGYVQKTTVGKYGEVRLTYNCNENYQLIRTRLATCIDGIWMNRFLPECKLKVGNYKTTTESQLIRNLKP
ncbi:complement factor H-related protein 5-like [Leptopilina boulardi]|uniref:complement factor H-related protein 5-like n=1 Tax=Leptopilina boulardi TaxID=63433 RepID=UPI0021F6633C|nr:complement factor H-related protein 5-like [Leptopilina boulardi]